MEGNKVRLTMDLTRYAKNLVAGSIGYTLGKCGILSRGSDRFISVCFPKIATLDVLREELEIISKECFKGETLMKNERIELLKNATNVINFVGSKGGFRYLSYTCINEHGIECSILIKDRNKSAELMEYFKDNEINVTTSVIVS